MWADKTAPPEESYRFVLFRPDWNPEIRYEARNYGEVRQSRCVQWPEHAVLPLAPPGRVSTWLPRKENRATCAMFVSDPHLRTYLCKLGWFDVTEAWARKPEPVRVAAPPVAVMGAPVAPAAPSRPRSRTA